FAAGMAVDFPWSNYIDAHPIMGAEILRETRSNRSIWPSGQWVILRLSVVRCPWSVASMLGFPRTDYNGQRTTDSWQLFNDPMTRWPDDKIPTAAVGALKASGSCGGIH